MEALEIKLIEKRLSKYSADQLLKKYNDNNFSSEVEKEIAKTLLLKRGKLLDGSKVEEVSQFELPTNSSLLEQVTVAIDHLYDKNDTSINKRILDIFDVDIENYNDLTEEQKLTIIDLHTEVFHPDRFVEKKKVDAANLKKAVEKVEHKELQPKVVGVKVPEPTKVKPAIKEVKVPKEKVEKPKKEKSDSETKTYDITSDTIKVGQEIEFDPSASLTELKGKKVKAEIIKIYFCGKTLKEYVRLKDKEGKTYHKRLSYFTK